MWYISFHGGQGGYPNVYAFADDGQTLLTKTVLQLDLAGSNAELRAMHFAPDGTLLVLNSRSSAGDRYTNTLLQFSASPNPDASRDCLGVVTSHAQAFALVHPFDFAIEPKSGDYLIASQDTNVVTKIYGPQKKHHGRPSRAISAYLQSLKGGFLPGTWVGSAALNNALPPDTPNGVSAVPAPAGLTFALTSGKHPKVAHSVRGLALDGEQLYVADEPANMVKIYDRSSGAYQSAITGDPSGKHTLKSPVHLLLQNGQLYIGSSGNARVFAYDLAARTAQQVLHDPALQQMTGVALGGDGALYVADAKAKQVRRYPAAGGSFGPGAPFISGLPDAPEFLLYL